MCCAVLHSFRSHSCTLQPAKAPYISLQVAVHKPVYLTAAEIDLPGLQLHPDFVTPAEEGALLQEVDLRPWESLAKRRVQHYGYKFEYSTRNVNSAANLGPLPDFLLHLVRRIRQLPGMAAKAPSAASVLGSYAQPSVSQVYLYGTCYVLPCS